MKILFDIFSSFESGRNGKLLTDSFELEGSTEEEIDKDFDYYLNNVFAKRLEEECNKRFEMIELNGQLQSLTISVEILPFDEDDNIIDEDSRTVYRYWSFHPFIGLATDEKEAQRLLDERLKEIRREDEEEERNF